MDDNLAAMQQTIDQLNTTIEAQRERIDALEKSNGNAQLLEKIDFLVEQAEAQRRQREEFEELKRDVMPIANQMIKLTIDEFAEIGSDFEGEHIFFLVKRMLRDTHMLLEGLNRLEMMMELYDETQRIGQGVFNQAIEKLDLLEREGYFAFAQSAWRILERIVQEFSEEDVDALGDNIVTILNTVKNLTQPEIMAMTNNALHAMQTDTVSDADVSTLSLLRDLRDPRVRQGMARMLNMLKVIADQPNPSDN
jgi:uncharacterized protein YjgD (DUF1641 family)